MGKLPDSIAAKYSEDLAQFAELRPVVRQAMSLHELVGLLLATTGKQPERVRALLRSGTCLYNIYRYWWEALEIDAATLEAVLAKFPDPDPTRAFRGDGCAWAEFADAHEPAPHKLRLEKGEAERRRWFRRQGFWDFLMAFAEAKKPVYRDYSYYHGADLYRAELTPPDRAQLHEASRRLAARAVQQRFGRGLEWAWLELGCPRRGRVQG